MGVTKSEQFTEEQNRIAALCKAMGHPARVAILQQIIKTKGCICGDLVKELPLAQATISQHLRELRDAGVIKGNIEGTSICYCIHPENWSVSKEVLHRFFLSFEDPECC